MSAEIESGRTAQAAGEFSRTRGIFRLWLGVLAAPLAFLFNLQADYYLSYRLCPGGRLLILHLVTILFVLAAAAGGFIAWRNWRRAGRVWPGEDASVAERSRFMAAVGLLMSAIFVVLLIAQLIPQFIFHPCQR